MSSIYEEKNVKFKNASRQTKIEYLKLLKKEIKGRIIVLSSNVILILTSSFITLDLWMKTNNDILFVYCTGTVIYMGFVFDIYYEKLKENIKELKELKFTL